MLADRVRAAAAALLCLLLGGCGYVGDPLPPALNIASTIVDLRVVEYGDRFIVDFTIPPLTTEGLVLNKFGEVDLRIGPTVAPFETGQWAAGASRVPVAADQAGPVHVEFPVGSWAGKDVVIGVRIVNRKERASSWSNLVPLRVVPPLAKPAEVAAQSAATGARITWKSSEPAFRVFRKGPGDKEPGLVGSASGNEYTDESAQFGTVYEYRVQAVRDLAESEISEPAQVTPRDVFAPAPPAGLNAVAGIRSVELLWERNTEQDLRGYRVYRATGSGQLERLGDFIDTPAYTDRQVETGKSYRYAVAALDQAGNESTMSGAVEITAP